MRGSTRRRQRRGRMAGGMLDVQAALWLGRRLWRPLAADLLHRSSGRRAPRRFGVASVRRMAGRG